jgi:SEC-C motif domain protein
MVACYCGSVIAYVNCCEPYHTGCKQASSAEILMRSRYSAFVVKQETYLLATWDVAKRPRSLDLSNDTTCWQRLEIIRCHKGRADQSQGTVEFKAYFQQDEEDFVLHEISRFAKKNAVWLYIDGASKISSIVITPRFFR